MKKDKIITRRDFLRTSAAGAGLLATVVGSVCAAEIDDTLKHMANVG